MIGPNQVLPFQGPSGPASYGNEQVLRIFQRPRITENSTFRLFGVISRKILFLQRCSRCILQLRPTGQGHNSNCCKTTVKNITRICSKVWKSDLKSYPEGKNKSKAKSEVWLQLVWLFVCLFGWLVFITDCRLFNAKFIFFIQINCYISNYYVFL